MTVTIYTREIETLATRLRAGLESGAFDDDAAGYAMQAVIGLEDLVEAIEREGANYVSFGSKPHEA
jgi:hypothetical protein